MTKQNKQWEEDFSPKAYLRDVKDNKEFISSFETILNMYWDNLKPCIVSLLAQQKKELMEEVKKLSRVLTEDGSFTPYNQAIQDVSEIIK